MSLNESPYEVNPVAESILDKFLKTVLIICIIIGVIGVFAAIIIATTEYQSAFLWLIPISILFVVIAGIFWAIGKVLINISRNLYNINDALRGGTIDEKKKSAKTGTVQKVEQEKAKEEVKKEPFKEGQWVMIKATRVKFCIDKLVEEGGQIRYYCSRLYTSFSADQLEPCDDD